MPQTHALASVAFTVPSSARSRTRYIEVTNGPHTDGLNRRMGFDVRFVPLRPYFTQAMDMLYAHLTAGAPLPSSQVVRTTHADGAPGLSQGLTASNIPPISMAPAAGDRITFRGTTLSVPQ